MKSLILKIFRKVKNCAYSYNSAIWLKKKTDDSTEQVVSDIEFKVDFSNRNIFQWLKDHHATYSWLYILKEIKCAEKNDHIFVTFVDEEEIIGYIKIGIKNVYVLDFDEIVTVPFGVAYIYDTFVLPEYRKKNIIPHAFNRITSHLRERGINEIFCHIPAWNIASIKLYKKLGFEEVAFIVFGRIFQLKFLIKDKNRVSFKVRDLFSTVL